MGKGIFYPNYDESILSLSCSVLKYFGVEPKHKTLPAADKILSKNYKHVVVILLDGLGINILEKHLSKNDFLRKHLILQYSSVFPPTTTASTTTFLSGLSPIEHGWLGWDVYFEQENKTVTCFTNNLQGTTEPAADYKIANKYFSYKNIAHQISETKNADAKIIFPFGKDGFPRLGRWLNEIKKRSSVDEKNFTYAYWTNPDHHLHLKGTDSSSVHKIVKNLNQKIQELCSDLKDTVVFVTADHGHTDVEKDYLVENHPELANMLIRRTVLEPRAMSFYVKDEFKNNFAEEFKKRFSEDYKIFSREDIFKMQLFGTDLPHKNLTGIGDFIAIAINKKILLWDKSEKDFKSHHAGLTSDEMCIPLICYEAKIK